MRRPFYIHKHIYVRPKQGSGTHTFLKDLMMKFFLPMIPPTITDQCHRIGKIADDKKRKVVVYDDPKLKEARAKIVSALRSHAPAHPFTPPIRVLVKWCFPIIGKHFDGEYKTTKPDIDNLQKILLDGITTCGFWENDAGVASIICEKFWSTTPGIFIDIQELNTK